MRCWRPCQRKARRQGCHTCSLISLDAGVLVGIICSLINVRSPAPPLVALVGLLGILAGEQIIPVGKQLLSGSGFSVAWREANCTSHMLGVLPARHADEAEIAATDFSEKRPSAMLPTLLSPMLARIAAVSELLVLT